MLMLQRAAENVNPSECNDPAVLLACSLGSDSCPAACQKDAEKASEEDTATQGSIDGLPIAGDLTIAVADYSDTVKSAPAVGTVVFNAVDFKASEKVTIESVKIERTGLSDKSAIKWVWFEKDGVAVSAKASLNSDGVATTRFYNNYSVYGTDTLDLVAELSGSAGSEIAFNIVGVTSTAKNASVNTKTTTYRTTTYAVATISFKEAGSAAAYKVGEKTSYEIGRFELQNSKSGSEDKDIIVKSLKLKNAWGLNLAETFTNVKVYKDSKVVSKNVTLDGKDMTITFDDDVLASGKKGIYTIMAEVAQLNEVNETVKLQLKKSTELVANEKSTGFRVNNTASNVYLKVYTFNGGKVTFSNDSKMAKTVNGAPSATDVVLGKGTLTISEPVKLSSVKFYLTWADNTNQIIKSIKNIKLEIGGTTYDVKAWNVDGWYVVYETNDDEIYVSKTNEVRVLVDVANEALTWKTISFVNLNGNSFTADGTYDNTDEPLARGTIAGAVQIADLVIKAGKFNITNKNSTTQKVVKGNSDIVTIFDGEITSNDGKVTVNDLYIKPVNTSYLPLNDKDQITLTLYVNGEPYADETYKTGHLYATFSNLGELTSSSSMKIKIEAQPNVSSTDGYVDFKVSAAGSDEQGNDTEASAVSAARLQITNTASITVANSNATSTVEKAGNSAELVSFSTTVKDGSYNVKKVLFAFTWDDDADLSNTLSGTDIELLIDGKTIDTTDGAASGLSAEFNINETLDIGKHTIALKASIDDTKEHAIKVSSVKIDGGDVKALNVKKLFVKAYPTISLVKKDQDSNEIVLKITNPASSEEDITISGFSFNNSASVKTLSLNDQTLDPAASEWNGNDYVITGSKQVTLAAGESTELRFEVANAWTSTAQLVGITVNVTSNDYVIDDDYTNIGKWADFKITYKS